MEFMSLWMKSLSVIILQTDNFNFLSLLILVMVRSQLMKQQTFKVSLLWMLIPASEVNSRSFAILSALSMKRCPPFGCMSLICCSTVSGEKVSPWKVLKSITTSASVPYEITPTWLPLRLALKNFTRPLAKSRTLYDTK